MRRLVLALMLVCSVAHADEKKRTTAQAMAGVGTGVSAALVIASFAFADARNPVNEPLLFTGLATSLVTPSLGQWYAGEYLTLGMGVRALAVGTAVFAVEHEQRTQMCTGSFDQCKVLQQNGVVMLEIAGIAYIGGAVWDLMDASDAVDRYNRRHGIFVSPTALASPSGVTPGLVVGGSW